MVADMAGKILSLKCVNCGEIYKPDENLNFCKRCGSILEFQLNYDYISSKLSKDRLKLRDFNMWRYWELIPIEDKSYIISLGEGGTPLIKSRRIGKLMGLKNLYFKLDFLNPTGSFKDRGASAAASRALELKVSAMVGFSTGNAGVAQAAYSAAAGIKSIVFVPKSASLEKIASMMIYGTKVFVVDGTFDDAGRIARKVASRMGWMYNGGVINPIRQEGKKTLAFEVCEQLNWSPPDWYIQSVGVGTAAIGAYKGFRELLFFGWISKIPRIACVQAEGCAPMAKAFKTGSSRIIPVNNPKTIASAIAVGNPAGWPLLRKAVIESDGLIEAVSDEAILDAYKKLAKLEGIYAEPAGAAPLALTVKLRDQGLLDKDDVVVCVISGIGLKDTGVTLKMVGKPINIPVDVDEALKVLSSNRF
ncbi:MAG: threonine synthase [Candidatus Verstraetearchaeota archaeon]|nr:threonine synthase [Candidatus Verstraetearchaeota archaeon]